ncbi:reverse transcriptase domain-containing protein [Artemisia annua]|uniref:Reverse transcriptase domain-containing protein n=1 Tax=Artemisia annua TaxID=35608 RepID=A0A2U1KKD1_ARTAN|nr:reverse transcriptase domain-containing protein [Artemisia annua]
MANEPEGVAQPMPEEITLLGKPPKKNITKADNLNDGLKVPTNLKTYDGMSDLDDHLTIFMGTMDVHKLLKPAWCRFFHITLCGAARFWYDNLSPGSINSFHELRDKFRANFLKQRRFQKIQAEILGIRQCSDESLRDYLGRFGKETLHMTDWSDEMMTGAFISGLRPTDEANTENRLRDSKWINSDNRHGVNHKDPSRKQKERFVSHPNTRPSDHSNNHKPSFTPLIKSPADIFATSASRIFTPGHHRDRTKYCDFHNDHGHDTNDFVDLGKEIEACVRSGRLSHLAKGAKTHNNNQTPTSFLPSDKEKNQIEWKRQDGKHKEANEILMTSVQ